MLLLSSLLLLIDGVTAAACINAVAGVPLVPDVLSVDGLPAIVASLMFGVYFSFSIVTGGS
jgi:hypothetical protein